MSQCAPFNLTLHGSPLNILVTFRLSLNTRSCTTKLIMPTMNLEWSKDPPAQHFVSNMFYRINMPLAPQTISHHFIPVKMCVDTKRCGRRAIICMVVGVFAPSSSVALAVKRQQARSISCRALHLKHSLTAASLKRALPQSLPKFSICRILCISLAILIYWLCEWVTVCVCAFES